MITKRRSKMIVLIIMFVSSFLPFQKGAADFSFRPARAPAYSHPVTGRPINISTGSIDETDPSVAYNSQDHEFIIVWANQRSVTDDIYAQRISETGKLLSWFYVADGEDPDVAYNPKTNSYLVAYAKYVGSDYDIYARRVDYTGPTQAEFLVAFNLNQEEIAPAVDYNTHPDYDDFLIVWENLVTSPSVSEDIEGQRVAGTAGGGDGGNETIGGRLSIAVGADLDSEPDVAYNLNMNEFLVVYTRSGSSRDVIARRVAHDTLGDHVLLAETIIDASGGDQYNPAVAAYRLNSATPYLVVFTDTWNDSAGDVRGYLVDQAAEPNTLINIADTTAEREFDPSIAQSEDWGGYVVTWTQGPVSDTDIFGMRVSNVGLTEPEFDIANYGAPMVCARETSDVAVGSVAALAVWSDDCGTAGGMDILGRLLGYQVYLPLVIR